jgi:hypothetical protein
LGVVGSFAGGGQVLEEVGEHQQAEDGLEEEWEGTRAD